MRSVSGTGFSREEASVNTLNFAVWHPTLFRLKPVPRKHCSPTKACSPTGCMRSVSRTGFSREEAGVNILNVAVWQPTLSRLKPVAQKACSPSQCMQSHWLHAVIQWDRLQPGRGRFDQPQFRGVTADAFPAKAGPTKSMRSQSMHAVPLAACGQSVGPASAGKRPV
jgi:hypothetical protein